nr:carboxyl transferase domain-containing protein [Corynebacterium tuberculostearicum]
MPVASRTLISNSVIPDTAAQAYDMSEVIKAVVDEGSFFELSAEAAQNILTGFAYIDGRAVGIVANQPLALAGALDSAAAEKAARFVRTVMPSILPSWNSWTPQALCLPGRGKGRPAAQSVEVCLCAG